MFRRTLPGLLWALFIMILCGIPGKDIPHISFLEILSFDKWVHAGLFFILELLLLKAFLPTIPKSTSFVITSLVIIYGGLLEILQGLVFSDRSADPYDFIANSFGALMGLLFYKIIFRKIYR